MYFDYSKLICKVQSFVILPRGYGRIIFDNLQERMQIEMDYREMLHYLDKIDMSLTGINTLINKKWYDEQNDIIKLVRDGKDSCSILKSTIKTETVKQKMINVLKNYCKLMHGCADCLLYNKGVDCIVGMPFKLSQSKFKEISDLYDKVEDWAKSFLLDED